MAFTAFVGRSSDGMASVAPKFRVYQNPSFSMAVRAKSLLPSDSTFALVLTISLTSAVALLAVICRGHGVINTLEIVLLSQNAAYFITRIMQMVVGLIFFSSISALFRVCYLRKQKSPDGVPDFGTGDINRLTSRQKELLGFKTNQINYAKSEPSEPGNRSDVLVPVHSDNVSSRVRIGFDWKSLSPCDGKHGSYNPLSSSPLEPNKPFLTVDSSPLPQYDKLVPSSWPRRQRSTNVKEIRSEAMLEEFLDEADKKFFESFSVVSPDKGQVTPPTYRSFGVQSPSSAGTSTTSGTMRVTPLRPARISPTSQSYSLSPKKGEDGMPLPMPLEEIIQVYESLGIHQHIDQWRDRLRQWFSSVILKPLVDKIETSHIQVCSFLPHGWGLGEKVPGQSLILGFSLTLQIMHAAGRLGISVNVSQVGSSELNPILSPSFSLTETAREWEPTCTLDQDVILHRLHATLVQIRDGPPSKQLLFGTLGHQQDPLIPLVQDCLDALVEHMRLYAVLKGDCVKGLLPYSSINAAFVVQRIQELAEGTCLKKYDYLGSGEVHGQMSKARIHELPSDSHLLMYLFCAFLENPKWILHVDPVTHASMRSSKNPLFLGFLPSKDRIPEKYVAILSGVPSILHPGALLLSLSKQNPPVFALYWNRKLQLAFQGRTAFWDAILLLCHHIQTSFEGVVRGLCLGSSPIKISSVLDIETEE